MFRYHIFYNSVPGSDSICKIMRYEHNFACKYVYMLIHVVMGEGELGAAGCTWASQNPW